MKIVYVYVAVMIGGAMGAFLRYLTAWALPFDGWTTLGINWVGCLVLGFWLTATKQSRVPDVVKVGFGTGVCGGFTTFSTFSVDALKMLESGKTGAFAWYIVLSLLGGVLMAYAGTLLARTRKGKEATQA